MSEFTPVNHVQLSGRVSSEPHAVTLPSGDEIVTFRLVVARDAAARKRSRQAVDVIECVAWTARLRRSVLRLKPDDHVELTGALRRRFSRGGGGVQSFASVEVAGLQRRGPVVGSDA